MMVCLKGRFVILWKSKPCNMLHTFFFHVQSVTSLVPPFYRTVKRCFSKIHLVSSEVITLNNPKWFDGFNRHLLSSHLVLRLPIVFDCLSSPPPPPSPRLSRHSTHSSDEAGFNDPSLLENLQNNHVSNVSFSFCLAAHKDKIKRD